MPYVREARPRTTRQFFALANRHMPWELNDLARRLDDQQAVAELCQGLVPAPVSRGSGLTPDGDVGRTMAGSTGRLRLISQRERDYDSRRDRDARPQPEAR
jgi:hypothetical protein